MNESMPSSVHPPQAAQKPRSWLRVRWTAAVWVLLIGWRIVRHRRDRRNRCDRNPPRRHGDTEKSQETESRAEKSSVRWQIYRLPANHIQELYIAKFLLVNVLGKIRSLAPELHFAFCPGGGQEIPHVRRTAPG